MGKIVNAMEEKLNRKNIMKVWKDYTTEEAISVIEKSGKAIKPKTITPCWGGWWGGNQTCVYMLHMTLQDLWQSQLRKSWKKLWI